MGNTILIRSDFSIVPNKTIFKRLFHVELSYKRRLK